MSKLRGEISEAIKKVTIRVLGVIFLTFVPLLVFAQTGPPPCDPNGTEGEPYSDNCPLDNWVWLLVVFAIIAVTYQAFRKRKALNSQI